MKRRVPVAADSPPELQPPELQVGRCIEIWADDCKDWISAWRNHGHALCAWQSVIHDQSRRSGGYPWSWITVAGTDLEDWYVEKLAKCGLTPGDIPSLREAATARLKDLPLTSGMDVRPKRLALPPLPKPRSRR